MFAMQYPEIRKYSNQHTNLFIIFTAVFFPCKFLAVSYQKKIIIISPFPFSMLISWIWRFGNDFSQYPDWDLDCGKFFFDGVFW
jgi:hypothetical protein